MKKIKIIYWTFTALVAALMGAGAIFDAISAPEAVAHVTRLGYPEYLIPFLGVAKLAGVVAILIPGFPKIKEWAYAGLTFDLLGALYSHIAFGDPVADWLPILVLVLLVLGSYTFYHQLQKKAATESTTTLRFAIK
jgi:hypothetical protein